MQFTSWVESGLMKICDSIFSVLPQQIPRFEDLSKCKIISHRGQHDNLSLIHI